MHDSIGDDYRKRKGNYKGDGMQADKVVVAFVWNGIETGGRRR